MHRRIRIDSLEYLFVIYILVSREDGVLGTVYNVRYKYRFCWRVLSLGCRSNIVDLMREDEGDDSA